MPGPARSAVRCWPSRHLPVLACLATLVLMLVNVVACAGIDAPPAGQALAAGHAATELPATSTAVPALTDTGASSPTPSAMPSPEPTKASSATATVPPMTSTTTPTVTPTTPPTSTPPRSRPASHLLRSTAE